MKKSKKSLSMVLALIMLMTVFISGCAQKDSVETKVAAGSTTETQTGTTTTDTQASVTEEPIELRVWVASPLKADYKEILAATPDNKQALMTKKIVEMFEASHPNVTLVLEDKGWDNDLKQQIMMAVLGGTGPDVTVGEAFIPEFIQLGAFEPIDIGDLANDLAPSSLKAATLDGQLYGVSGWTGVFALQYNEKVMQDAGLDPNAPPQTLDELVEMSKTVYDSSNGSVGGIAICTAPGLGSAFRYAVLMRQFGGWFVNEDNTEATINTEANAKAMEYWRELAKYTLDRQVYMTDEGQILSLIHKDQVAFQIDGSWQIDWTKGDGNENCAYTAIPVNPDGKRGNLIVGNVIFSVLKQSEHKEMATEFVKFMGSEAVQIELFRADGRIPSNLKAANSPEIIESKPEMAAFIDELANSDAAPLPGYTKNSGDIYLALDAMFQEVLTTDRPIMDILNDTQTIVSELLK